ncbi:MAG: hypothetical protein ACREV4_00145 [Gammaproteobacteria bacterium]
MQINIVQAHSILTRTCGYLRTIATHSLQPYRGCTFGNALCGVGCYVQHNTFLTRGERWGRFLDARVNAPDLYRRQYHKERSWAKQGGRRFVIFMSSSTDPFLPQEQRFGITRAVLEAMLEQPPDGLIIQTHTHLVARYLEVYRRLGARCRLRTHISIETDRHCVPGLPPPASPVGRRLEAAYMLREAGVRVVITVAPLLPIADPDTFFRAIERSADAVVIDHFIGGDGTANGSRTWNTPLPGAMAAVEPSSIHLSYREQMVAVAEAIMPGRVGVGIDGFAGRFRGAGD